jgi:hypothetical protein
MIAKGAVGIEAGLAVIGAIKLATDFSVPSALLVIFVIAIIAGGGILVFTKLGGAAGTIAADGVTIKPSSFLGLKTNAPAGTFRLDQFGAVRVEEATETKGFMHDYQRVYLAGKAGTPDILVARTQDRDGRRLGVALGALLHLPVEETRMAY